MNVVITGASTGIGFELVKKFAENPKNAVYAIVRTEHQVAQFSHISSNIIPVIQDLNTNDLITFKNVFTRVPHVDILINNAGVLVKKSFFELDDDEWQHMFNVNVFSAVRIIKYLLPLMGINAPTHIVNIGSMGGVQGSHKFAGLSAYSASKSALIGLTESLAEEFKNKNIYVNCLALGAVQTKMLHQAFPNYEASNSAASMAEYIYEFSLNGHKYFNGKVLPVATSTP
jgi:NAD(P)-dependent dehydrogenase (short-subunit alcohol dehydrogenase family)